MIRRSSSFEWCVDLRDPSKYLPQALETLLAGLGCDAGYGSPTKQTNIHLIDTDIRVTKNKTTVGLLRMHVGAKK